MRHRAARPCGSVLSPEIVPASEETIVSGGAKKESGEAGILPLLPNVISQLILEAQTA